MARDFYQILDIPKNSTFEEIKRAYRNQALKWHPDKHDNLTPEKKDEAKKKFLDVCEAYEILSNPGKKMMYDQYGEDGLKNGVGVGTGEDSFSSSSPFTTHEAEQIFNVFFSNDNTGRKGVVNGSSVPLQFAFNHPPTKGPIDFGPDVFMARKGVAKDPNIFIDLELPMADFYYGVTKTIQLNRKDFTHPNHVKLIEQTVEVKIQPGTPEGTRLTQPNMGDVKPNVQPADVTFVLKMKPEERFVKNGSKLIYKHPLTLNEMLQGFTLKVPSLLESVAAQENQTSSSLPSSPSFPPLYEQVLSPVVNPQKNIVIPEKGFVVPFKNKRDDLIILFDTLHWEQNPPH